MYKSSMAIAVRPVQQALNMLEEEYWYVGSISERKAEEILTSLGSPGCFLVRDSFFPEADYVLSVLGSQKQINHFPVIIGENNSCTLNNYIFDNILTAINFYCENRLTGVFLNLPTTSVVKDTDIPSVTYQPVIRPVQYSKTVKAPPYHLPTSLQRTSFSPSSCSSGDSPIYDTIDPEFGVKAEEARNTSMLVQERKVSPNSQDSETYSDGLDSPPLVRYQTDNGSIYTLPNCRRGNLQKIIGKTNTLRPSLTPNSKYKDGVSSSGNSPSLVQCRKTLFEQFSKPDLLDVRNIGPEPVKLTSDHMKPNLRRMNTVASASLIPPAPPPPPPPRSPAASKGPSSNRVNCKGTLKSIQSEPLLVSSDKQPPWSPHRPTIAVPTATWSPHGPTIAVPTAILAGMKQHNKTVPFDEEESEETFIDQTYSPRYSSVGEDNVPSTTHYAIPTAILAGIAPTAPMRFESAQCGFLQRPSSIYNSAESLLDVEDDHSKVTYIINTDKATSRRGSLTSATSSPALLSGGKGEDNDEGKLRRIKKFFRKK